MKPRRVYDLFAGPKGPTAYTSAYGCVSKRIWKVVAVSVKQAIFLAAKGVWFDEGTPGSTGIIGTTGDASDSPWTWFPGCVASSQYKHGEPFVDPATQDAGGILTNPTTRR